MVIQIKNKVC